MAWVEVNLSAIRQNALAVKSHIDYRRLIAVVKADAADTHGGLANNRRIGHDHIAELDGVIQILGHGGYAGRPPAGRPMGCVIPVPRRVGFPSEVGRIWVLWTPRQQPAFSKNNSGPRVALTSGKTAAKEHSVVAKRAAT